MAVQTIYLLGTTAVTPYFWGNTQLNGSAPTAANSAFGWAPAKTAITTPYYRGHLGATATSTDPALSASYNASTSGPTVGTGTGGGTAGDCFVVGPLTGTFAATAWTFNFNMRAGTAGCIGHVNMKMYRSTNLTGAVATQLIANTAGATVTLSTTADTNSSITASPGQIVLNNAYLFFQVEWQETTAGSSNNDNVFFRIGTASITTADFVAAVTGTVAVTEISDTIVSTGRTPYVGTLVKTEAPDTLAASGGPIVGGTLARSEVPDTLAATGTGPAAPIAVAPWPPAFPQHGAGQSLGVTNFDAPGAVQPAISGLVAVAWPPAFPQHRAGQTTGVTNYTHPGAVQPAYQIAGTGITGTLAVTETADTLSATGTAPLVAITGTLSVTESPDTVTAAGTVQVRGTLTATQANQTIVATGGVTVSGTLARTQANHTLVATGTGLVSGTLGITQANQTLVATGAVISSGLTGTLNLAQAPQTLTATGSVGYGPEESVQASPLIDLTYPGPYRVGNEVHFVVAGQITKAQFHRPAASTITSRPMFLYETAAGTLVATSNASVAETGTGWVQVAFPSPIPVAAGSNYVISYDVSDIFSYGGSAPNVTNAAHATWIIGRYGDMGAGYPAGLVADTNYSADVIWQPLSLPAVLGILAVTETPDTIAATGTVRVSGTLGVNQAPQTIAASGGAVVSGTLGVQQANQTIAASGGATASGSLAAAQAAQAVAATGTVRVSGTLAVSQAAQTAVAVGTVGVTGALSLNQAPQTLVATGTILTGVIGNLNLTQASQTLASAGTVTGFVGTLNQVQANQTVAASGTVALAGSLNRTQADQTLVASGVIIPVVYGTASLAQAPQTLLATATVVVSGRLTVSQDNQTLAATALLGPVTGALALSQANQTLQAIGVLRIVGGLDRAQDDQTLVATGGIGNVWIPGVPGTIPDVPPDRLETPPPSDRLVVATGDDRLHGTAASPSVRTVTTGNGGRLITVPPLRRVA
jgi:hypothetical protein